MPNEDLGSTITELTAALRAVQEQVQLLRNIIQEHITALKPEEETEDKRTKRK